VIRRTLVLSAATLLIAAGAPARADGLDPFVGYQVKKYAQAPDFARFGPVTLGDQLRSADYEVRKPVGVVLPAEVNGVPLVDDQTSLLEYLVSPTRDTEKFDGARDVRITNPCNDLLLEVHQPASLLIPTHVDVDEPATVPDPLAHAVDAFLCYDVAAQKKASDGTPLPVFPEGIQVDATDEFQTRRYDLIKITRLCNPVDVSGSPVLLEGQDKGAAFPVTPTPIRNPDAHLVCYRAKRAKKFIAQSGCGPATPGDDGTKIDPPQQEHLKRRGVFVANQFGSGILDTAKEVEVCLPSTKELPGG
jgi:hypothetical protein